MIRRRIRRVPLESISLQRIQEVHCLCGHTFKIDLGARGMGTTIKEIRCSKCGSIVGTIEDAIFKEWRRE